MPGVFPWFMHAPEWENKMVRAECIEHGEKSSIISLWEPRLLEEYDISVKRYISSLSIFSNFFFLQYAITLLNN